jgi:hypothetical protein
VAQLHFNARQDFAHIEWFEDVIVGARVERLYLVRYVRFNRDNDNRQPGIHRTNFLANPLPVHIQQPHIQQHQIDFVFGQESQGLLALLGNRHFVAMLFKAASELMEGS